MTPKNRKKALALAISSALWGTVVYAQDQTPAATEEYPEEIIVKGVRASQAKAIEVKRDSVNVVDSIVAEDIGKLPDATITDSLSRVTGVQIKKEANEGTTLNVRGMPQVLTTLNGEQFLSSWSITTADANYGDIPAGMISRVDVYKSQSANIIAGGISGVVDFKTTQPLQLKEGFTGNVRVNASQGQLSKKETDADGNSGTRKPDEDLSVFVGYNNGGDFGFTLAGFKQSTYNANYQMQMSPQLAFLDHQNGTPTDPLDLNGNGDKVNDWYLAPGSYGATSDFVTRERKGASLSIEAAVSDNFTVRGDVFYTHMDQSEQSVSANFGAGSSYASYEVNGVKTGESNLNDTLLAGTQVGDGSDFTYTDDKGVVQTRHIHTLRIAEVLSPDFMSTSRNNLNRTGALNTNFELDYDNQDNLKAKLRYVYAKAERENRTASLQQGAPAWLWTDTDGISGKDPVTPYRLTVDLTKKYPTTTYDGDVSDAAKLALYQAAANGSNADASLNILRYDVNYAFNGKVVSSVDVGFRHGKRTADYDQFYYVTPSQRYADDQRIPVEKRNQLEPGNLVWQRYPDWRYFDYTRENKALRDAGLYDSGFNATDASITKFTDFGPFKGFEGGVSALNPTAWSNPLAFMNRLYPGTKTVDDPSYQYTVTETSTSGYAQVNLDDTEGLFGIPYKGNVGLQIQSTDREVTRNKIPETLDVFNSIGGVDYQRLAFVYDKDRQTRSYVQLLPSLNINFFPADDVVVRFGATKTTTRNDLNNVGAGKLLWLSQCDKTDENGKRIMVTNGSGDLVGATVTCVGGGSDTGNIDIKPWSANVYNTSAEWYFDKNAVLALALFKIDVSTAVQSLQERRNFVDADGIDRGNTGNVWITKNIGASSLSGLEVSYRTPFTFLPGPFLSAFGMELNGTVSKSDSGSKDLDGNSLPLQSNSKYLSNFVLYYDKNGLNVRLAYNWKSKEYIGYAGLNTSGQALNLATWAKPISYVDLQVNYWLNEHFSFNVSGENLTAASQIQYAQYPDQISNIFVAERRLKAGVTFSF